jgi:hypothetical protein
MRAATRTMAGTLRECNRRAALPASFVRDLSRKPDTTFGITHRGKASAVRTPAGRGAKTDTDESDES